MELFFKDFSSWLQGMLFILIAYHSISFFFTKDKSFIIYAGYLILVLIYLIPRTNNVTSHFILKKFGWFFLEFNWIIQIWYWMLYTWFSIYFLNIKDKNEKLFKQIKLYILITTIVSTLFFFTDLFFLEKKYMTSYFVYIYTPVSLFIISFFLRIIYKFKDKINKFFVIGLISFLGFAIISLVFSFSKTIFFNYIVPIDFFKFGVLLEAITISIGLGYKYHLYRKERDDYNQLLINNLKEKINLKQEIENLRLVALRSQMNPHFIFNALNSIKLYIINNDSKNAAHYLNKFSKLIRRILDASSSKKATLKEELETMDLYLTIENIRFSNEINFQFNIEKNLDLNSIFIPPLILQPFLENAIWHGLSSKKGEKNININIKKISDVFAQIIIEDNGIGRKASEIIKQQKSINRKSVGIDLTKERLRNFMSNFEHNFSLIFNDLKNDNNESIGTQVVLNIPTT